MNPAYVVRVRVGEKATHRGGPMSVNSYDPDPETAKRLGAQMLGVPESAVEVIPFGEMLEGVGPSGDWQNPIPGEARGWDQV